MSFNDRFWRIFLGKSLWLNPLMLMFIILAVAGTFMTNKEDGGNIVGNMGKTIGGLAMIGAMVAFVCTIIGWLRDKGDNQQEQPSEDVPPQPTVRRNDRRIAK